MQTIPYGRLSGFYLFYFATVGIFMPYATLFLQYLEFDAQSIGELMAISMATKIISPNLAGWMADHTGKHLAITRIGSFLAIFVFAGIFWGQSYLWMALIIGSFSFFWNATLPTMEAITLGHLGNQSERYSQIRLWGSIGFIITVIAAGKLFEAYGIQLLPHVVISLSICIFITVLLIPATSPIAHHTEDPHSFYQKLRQPAVIVIFTSFFLMQFSTGPFYGFFTIYLESHDYPKNVIGLLWALGVVAEIVAFMKMSWLMQRFSLKTLLLVAFIITGIRWLLIGFFVDELAMVVIIQLMHAASFGVYHAVSIELIRVHFSSQQQTRALALYSSTSFGLGGALGIWLSGNTWTLPMGELLTYTWAAGVCLVAVVLVWVGLSHKTSNRV